MAGRSTGLAFAWALAGIAWGGDDLNHAGRDRFAVAPRIRSANSPGGEAALTARQQRADLYHGSTPVLAKTGAEVLRFSGIRFAEAPVGDWRWREPRPAIAASADGSVDATKWPPACVQDEGNVEWYQSVAEAYPGEHPSVRRRPRQRHRVRRIRRRGRHRLPAAVAAGPGSLPPGDLPKRRLACGPAPDARGKRSPGRAAHWRVREERRRALAGAMASPLRCALSCPREIVGNLSAHPELGVAPPLPLERQCHLGRNGGTTIQQSRQCRPRTTESLRRFRDRYSDHLDALGPDCLTRVWRIGHCAHVVAPSGSRQDPHRPVLRPRTGIRCANWR